VLPHVGAFSMNTWNERCYNSEVMEWTML